MNIIDLLYWGFVFICGPIIIIWYFIDYIYVIRRGYKYDPEERKNIKLKEEIVSVKKEIEDLKKS